MTRFALFGAAALALSAFASPHVLAANKMVGGAEMYPSKTIVENAANSGDHKALVAAVQAAGLVDTLSGAGPFTVFAPVDQAFAALPDGTVETLLKPENKDQLVGVLTYHVVPGRLDAADIVAKAQSMGGKVELETVQGEMLTVTVEGDSVVVTDAKGGSATVTIADVGQSNGVIHVIDAVLIP